MIAEFPAFLQPTRHREATDEYSDALNDTYTMFTNVPTLKI